MRPTVICGPSGVGKRKLIETLQSKVPNTFGVAVSHTTRARKPNETDGIHYWFVDKQQFETKTKEKQFFVEHVLYDSHYYGTSLESIHAITNNNNPLICILDIDVFGAEQIKSQSQLECNYLFITTSNGLNTLKKRLTQRHTESTQEIHRRLETAKTELEFIQNNPNFFDSVIYNDIDIDETFFNLREQLIAWYPHLKHTILQSDDAEEKENMDDDEDLANVFRITMCSKRQSLDIYADFNKNATFVTQEALCKEILYDNTPLQRQNGSIIDIICEYTDIPPKNRRTQWKMENEYTMIVNKVTSNVQHRWTLGNEETFYPMFNTDTIGDIYFAYHETVINGILFYLCGTVKCPMFAKKYFKARIETEEDIEWDKCWDIYFYMKCDSEYRGSIQFSAAWSNMLIFGIDNDAIRQAVENGIWKLNTMQSNNFLIKPSLPSSVGTIDDDEDDEIIDQE